MATEAGVAAASTAAVGFGLFNYNRAETQWICSRMAWGGCNFIHSLVGNFEKKSV